MSYRFPFVSLLVSSASLSGPVQEAWVRRYHGPGYGDDQPSAIAVDPKGNVYVTGASFGWPRSYREYTTLKYDSEGNQLWLARYHFPLYGGDEPVALALDADGNVYVTGRACTEARVKGACTRYAFGTIKYNPQGRLLWANRFHAADGDNLAAAIAVDANGNAYVTGSCSFLPFPYPNPNTDYSTVKYDTDGHLVWAARYHGPSESRDGASAIAVDPQGNAYVTGGSGPNDRDRKYATIMYDADGNEVWVARSPGRGGVALALDTEGNVFVTGVTLYPSWDYLTVKYDPGGTEVWVARYETPEIGWAVALAADFAGNVYVTGAKGGQYATVKYDSKGNEVWVGRYHGPGLYADVPIRIAVDGQNNAYVTGQSSAADDPWQTDYATVKYDPEGNELWAARYHGSENYVDRAWSLALDAMGNVYVTGWSYFRNFFGGLDAEFATIKYSQ